MGGKCLTARTVSAGLCSGKGGPAYLRTKEKKQIVHRTTYMEWRGERTKGGPGAGMGSTTSALAARSCLSNHTRHSCRLRPLSVALQELSNTNVYNLRRSGHEMLTCTALRLSPNRCRRSCLPTTITSPQTPPRGVRQTPDTASKLRLAPLARSPAG
jgi:hypothetical protein